MKSTNSFVEQYNELRRENGQESVSAEDMSKALDAFNAGGEGVEQENDRAGHRAPSHAQKKSPFDGC
ncbi:TPA: hypothetical protein ACOEEL_001990 [Enterobacter kobei]